MIRASTNPNSPITNRSRHIRHLIGICAAVVALFTGYPYATLGQGKSSDGKLAGGAKMAIPELMTDAPYEIPSLGLSVFLPRDALVDLSHLQGGPTSMTIRPQGDATPWVMQILSSVSADHSLTLKDALDNIITQRQAQYTRRNDRGASESLVRPFARMSDLTIGPYPAERVYLDVPTRPEVPTSGYTLFKTGPGQFVIFQIDCVTSAFPGLQSLYETMVATVQFRDPSEMQADRAGAILAGKALLDQFNRSDIEAVLDEAPAFYRLYKPAPTGAAGDAREVGYQRLSARAGFAGELDPRKPRRSWSAADRREGYIVQIDARTLTMGAVVDTVTIFFLSQDRTQELWSNTMVVRKDGQTEQWIETGIRRDTRLTVKTVRSGAEPTSADWSPIPNGYASRALTYLIPRLVVRSGLSGEYGFYTYESALSKMTLRRDSFEPAGGGEWSMSTRTSENSPPIVTRLDASGRPLRRETPDGTVMEPVEKDRLRRLWKEKSLPMD